MSSRKPKMLNENAKVNKKRQRSSKPHFQYSQENVTKALNEIQEGRMSIRTASQQFGVPKTTLQNYKSGKVPQIPRKTGPPPLLTIECEKKIVDWVINLAKCGFFVKKQCILDTVEAVVKDTGKSALFKDGKPGLRWYLNFLKRHPQILLRETRTITSEQCIRAWFQDLKNHLAKTNNEDILLDPNRILNGDAAGLSVDPKTGKVLPPKDCKNVCSTKMGNDETDNITVFTVFTASGKICPPLVLFHRPPTSLLENMPSNSVLGRSENDWMKEDGFFEYIANDFHQWVKENYLKKPILLLLDGRKSHVSLPLSDFCADNGIILYALPPNTTDILRPANVSVLRPLKYEWDETMRNVDDSVTKFNFCRVFQEALNDTNMTDHIINGFRKCGLYPFEPDNVDYTKYTKNFSEEQNDSTTNDTQSEVLTVHDFQIARKVLDSMKGTLTTRGINIDVILKEIDVQEDACEDEIMKE